MTLSQNDGLRLTAGLTDLCDISAHASVPLVTRKLARVTAVWLNKRWLLERGFDPFNTSTYNDICSWFVERYGYVVPREEDEGTSFLAEEKIFFADRYGETGVVKHGGSGRAATDGPFHVKGIGVTPLIGGNADWLHSHGCAWMEEAIREAVYSEIFAAESPYGAVPTVAILDTHLHAEMPKGCNGERRALIIRPSFVRLAHLQRATHFLPTSGKRFAQLEDVERTKDFVRWFCALTAGDENPLGLPTKHVVRQIAFCQVHRLIHGGFYSSNLTVDGELVDFGGARALPNWVQAEVLSLRPRFGEELDVWHGVVNSLSYYIHKFSKGDISDYAKSPNEQYRDAFSFESLRVFGLDRSEVTSKFAEELVERLQLIYRSQQRHRLSYVTGDPYDAPWIYFEVRSLLKRQQVRDRHLNAIVRVLEELHERRPDRDEQVLFSLSMAARHFKPREILYREVLQKYLFENVVPKSSADDLEYLAIDRVLTLCCTYGRRVWPKQYQLALISQYSDGLTHCFVVKSKEAPYGEYALVDSPATATDALVFGRWYSIDNFKNCDFEIVENRCAIRFKVDMDDQMLRLSFGANAVTVGPMLIFDKISSVA
jgi:hypothetical protein